jgi:hypothetical protein
LTISVGVKKHGEVVHHSHGNRFSAHGDPPKPSRCQAMCAKERDKQ